jgi:hypothetical protein
MTRPKLKARRKTFGEAIRSARQWGGVVIKDYPGTTTEYPWGVVAPAPDNRNTSSKSGP